MVQNMKFKVYHMTNIRNRIWNIICSKILKQGCENLIFWWCAPAHIRVGSCQKRPVETFAKAKVVLDDNSFYATKSLLYSRPRFFDILKLCYSINAPWWWPRTLMMTCFFLIRLFLLPCCSLPTKKHYFYTNIIKKKPSKKSQKC